MFFNKSNLGLSEIYEVRVTNITDPRLPVGNCNDVLIYTFTNKYRGCMIAGLKEKEITVANTGSSVVVFEVTLTGRSLEVDPNEI